MNLAVTGEHPDSSIFEVSEAAEIMQAADADTNIMLALLLTRNSKTPYK